MGRNIATALTVRNGDLEWTTLKGDSRKAGVVASRKVSLQPAGEDCPDIFAPGEKDPAELAAFIKTQCSGMAGPLSLGLPSDRVLLRVLELPSVEPKDVAGMVQLQADKLSPFPTDDTAVSHEVLSTSESASRVLIAVAQRSAVDAAGRLFGAARIFPQRADVATLGWLRLLSDAGHLEGAGTQVMILLDKPTAELIVTEGGLPILFRSLGRTEELAGEDLAQEVSYALATLEAEAGTGPAGNIRLWHWGAPPRDLLEAAHGALAQEVEAKQFESLPPLSEGLARRALSGQGLDLAPAEWQAGENQLRLRRNLVAASIAALTLWALAVGSVFGLVSWQTRRLAAADSETARAVDAAREVRRLQNRVRLISRYTNTTWSALECMRQAVVCKPDDIEFTSFLYDRSDKKQQIQMAGETAGESTDPVDTFVASLRTSELFKDFRQEPVSITRKGNKHSFTVTMEFPQTKP